ncbi:MAG: polysaccharide deacetylase family protein, partial [Alistipes sp.]|nr:polysaccharide deacetylase family protein [Alistipes sp.]
MKRLLILLAALTALVGCTRDKGYIALTFDDGPSSTTMEILDVMEEFGARGSFFVIGSNINDKS